MKASLVLATFCVAVLLCARTFATITIETVPIGDVGNPNDPATGNLYGGVNYAYSIGKYEVTTGQYVAFLNSIAATDTYGVFKVGSGIVRGGSSGSYHYTPVGSPNHPFVSLFWGDAARFANWLHNGQPVGMQGSGTTEDGAYTLNGATSNTDVMAVSRNPDAKWFITSESEWYKAAYYQPAAQGGDSDSYWNYPMRTNAMPFSDQPPGATPDNTRVGNFFYSDGVANGYNDGYAVTGSFTCNQDCRTDVGAYSSSPSYYGTFDQGGNAWEWTESLLPSSSSHAIRGGAFDYDAVTLTAYVRSNNKFTSPFIGFRVANVVPEPSVAMLVLIGSVALVLRCWRLRVN